MAIARIKRIKKISDYRAFKSWVGDGSTPEFRRANVIYGTNGSGKSTLASLMRECFEKTATSAIGLQVEIEENGQTSNVTESSVDLWQRVRVFNRDYVDQNLRFDDVEGPSPGSLLTLGKVNVDNEKELAEKKERRDTAKSELVVARREHSAAESQIQTRQSAVAGTIVSELQRSELPRFRGTNVYTRANVKSRLIGDRSILSEASTDISADIARATALPMQPFVLAPAPNLAGDDALDRVRQLLSTEIAATAIESLRGHGDRSVWVQQGIGLHEGLSECLLCGQPLTEERRHELTAHFDEALQKLQLSIDNQITELQSASTASKSFLSGFPEDRDIYAEFVEDLKTAHNGYETSQQQYESAIDQLIKLLRAKRDNPFPSPALSIDFALLAPSAEEIDAMVTSHKVRSDAHGIEVDQAATKVELARISEFSSEYDLATSNIAKKTQVISDLETELKDLDDRITTLENVTADPVPKAEELTRNVARLLGRTELTFRATSDGMHYKIERFGRSATNLSEGERTAISLLHFLASVHSDVLSGDEPILVIDDPVSSLDHEILFGASSFLWANLVPATHIGQFFLLTHNFELFRQWIVQMERAPKSEVPDGYTIFELRMKYYESAPGELRRVPRLEPWNSKLSNQLRSQYHFWFYRVARTLLEATPDIGLAERMELLALAPNAARRMLEGFLSFRYPQHIASFHKAMGEVLTKIDDQALRNRVERYLHAYSHNEEGDISAMLDPSEATTIFRSLFVLMKAVDSEHVTAMCQALEIDESKILQEPTLLKVVNKELEDIATKPGTI